MSSGPDARPPLDPSRLPERVQVVEELASTNSRVTELAREGAPAGTVVVTEWQTAGRGRLDRVWTVPPRTAITFSVLLRPDLAPADWPWLPLLAGYVVRTALSDRVPGIGLKWPNDVLVGEEGRKLCGILVERVETAGGPAAVVGIGVNADQCPDELPVAHATSLRIETGAPVDRTAVLVDLLETFDDAQQMLDDVDSLRAAYAAACVTVGRRVRVHLPGGAELVGEAVGLDEFGRLLVDGGDGVVAVGAGDVVHVRPAT